MEEIAAVAAAHGVSLQDDAVSFAMNTVDTFPAEGTSSLQRDIATGSTVRTRCLDRRGPCGWGQPSAFPLPSIPSSTRCCSPPNCRRAAPDGPPARARIDLTRDGTMDRRFRRRRG